MQTVENCQTCVLLNNVSVMENGENGGEINFVSSWCDIEGSAKIQLSLCYACCVSIYLAMIVIYIQMSTLMVAMSGLGKSEVNNFPNLN